MSDLEQMAKELARYRAERGCTTEKVYALRNALFDAAYEELEHTAAAMVGRTIARLKKNNPMISREDLLAHVMEGLLDACDNYDFVYNTSFATFAKLKMNWALVNGVRGGMPAYHKNWSQKTDFDEVVNELEQRHGRAVTTPEIAQELDISIRDVEKLQSDLANKVPVIKHEPGFGESEESRTIYPQLVDYNCSESVASSREVFEYLHDSMDILTEDELTIILLHFARGRSLREIGDIMGLTKQRIAQIKDRALMRLYEVVSIRVDDSTLDGLDIQNRRSGGCL